MLFPFARQIMASATQQGGFPPLMLDPIDFAGMYQQRLAQEQGGEAVCKLAVQMRDQEKWIPVFRPSPL